MSDFQNSTALSAVDGLNLLQRGIAVATACDVVLSAPVFYLEGGAQLLGIGNEETQDKAVRNWHLSSPLVLRRCKAEIMTTSRRSTRCERVPETVGIPIWQSLQLSAAACSSEACHQAWRAP